MVVDLKPWSLHNLCSILNILANLCCPAEVDSDILRICGGRLLLLESLCALEHSAVGTTLLASVNIVGSEQYKVSGT
jgi:hypothetical protein